MRYGFSSEAFFITIAAPFLAALMVIDLRHMILPNQLVVILAGIGLARLAWQVFFMHDAPDFAVLIQSMLDVLIYAGIAWLLGFIMQKILKKEALGFGDVKFFALTGLWVGTASLGWFCLLSGVIGLFFAAWWKRWKGSDLFPFGPALILSFYILIISKSSFFF
mgnify:CR=1 FL=1